MYLLVLLAVKGGLALSSMMATTQAIQAKVVLLKNRSLVVVRHRLKLSTIVERMSLGRTNDTVTASTRLLLAAANEATLLWWSGFPGNEWCFLLKTGYRFRGLSSN